MNKISIAQKAFLERVKSYAKVGYPVERIIERIWNFLNEKPEEEPLDPRWLDIWEKYKQQLGPFSRSRMFKEINNSIMSIKVIDKEIWKLRIDADTKITFLLGAGTSAPSGIPTVDILLSELWKRARKIGREDLDKLADWCNEQEITNIEDLLTTAYISNFAAKNRSITSLFDYFLFSGGRHLSDEEEYSIRHRRSVRTSLIDVSSISFLQDTLQTLFGLLTSTMISARPNPTHEAIVEFIKKHNKISIITTNYDGCMDEALLKARISLKGTIASDIEEDNPNAVDLIKMHGSINWAYCDSCQDVREFDLIELKKMYEKDKISYPVLGICKNCGGLRRPLLVPPLSFKFLMFPHLVDIWNSARQSIEKAEYLIIVGYSFSEADTYIIKIISRSMSMNKNQIMIIVNTDSSLVPNLRDRFSSHIDGFDKNRVIKACENSEIILPEILNSMLGKSVPKKEIKVANKKRKAR